MPSLVTRASAALDRSIVRFMERRMLPRARGNHLLDPMQARARLIALAAHYNASTLGAESPFFATPALPDPVQHPQGHGPFGTRVIDLEFSSEYEPFHPEARESFASATENLTVHARWWTSGARDRRPTIVLIHGWGGGTHWITERTFAVSDWLRLGFDVVAYVLPYHAQRAPAGRANLWPSPNPLRTNEGFGQAIHDLRALARYLRAMGSPAVGAFGMSLGGYTTALWTGVAGPQDLGGVDFAVAMIPAVSMARLLWQHGEASPMRKRALAAGITEDLLVDAFAVHAPLTRAPKLPTERLAVVAGRGDRITFPEQAEALARHWGVDVSWFDGGHLAQLGRADALRAVRRQLVALELPGRAPRSSRLRAP